MLISNLVWKHHSARSNVFVEDPAKSALCGIVYGFDGGFLWEVRFRCPCCKDISLIRQGTRKTKTLAMEDVEKFIQKWLRIHADD